MGTDSSERRARLSQEMRLSSPRRVGAACEGLSVGLHSAGGGEPV